MAVITAVADATDNDFTDLEPLYSTIDPDALDSLFQSGPGGQWQQASQVSFRFAGCDVVVHGDRKVVVKPPRADEATEQIGKTS